MKILSKEMKTLIINGKLEATGNSESLLRHAKKVIRNKHIESPSISLVKGMILKLEDLI